jgi:hypothetical protein
MVKPWSGCVTRRKLERVAGIFSAGRQILFRSKNGFRD